MSQTSLHRIRAPSHSTSLLLSSTRSGALLVDGCELTKDRCLILDGGNEVELIAYPGSSWLLISVAFNLLGDTTSSCARESSLRRCGVRMVAISMSTCLALESEAANTLSSSGNCSVASGARALAIRVLLDAADGTITPTARSALHDARARRHHAVERARRYIWEHLSDPIRLADLCAYAHIEARSLEYGFRELVRLSPMAYVRMLRLGEVRAQLLRDATARRSISEIALDVGFSHLSQFVVDYKKVFGETPSTTRRGVVRSVRISRAPQRPTADADAASQRKAMGYTNWSGSCIAPRNLGVVAFSN